MLLQGLDLRATALTVRTAALARDAGRGEAGVDDRAQVLRTEARLAGVTAAEATVELVLAFHHAIRDDQQQLADSIQHLNAIADRGDYASYADIAHFMANRPQPAGSSASTRWIGPPDQVHTRWRDLVTARRSYLDARR
ncbi:hypothetical protein OIE63_39255 (plasmid) [Streptomyces sp. NBC_01795]|uniref:hypothetical protein n=1 Tax=unclassified Streptomyces TaxID=2593676 RepID=UPI002DDB81B6|nr:MULTISPECIES: hypothetical protein [unclassified Streptomyces]WSA97566.1 hypothetical protein OIE63_39255 [Streptomyces sp. NBC_01795]WSB82186.1 hypothetical protein OHB04_41560 [Streptomyces sp. NBC_01775]WSS18157.1 hypothetical protein OG533_40640 [Streptomyces sp. NBC_01186]